MFHVRTADRLTSILSAWLPAKSKNDTFTMVFVIVCYILTIYEINKVCRWKKALMGQSNPLYLFSCSKILSSIWLPAGICSPSGWFGLVWIWLSLLTLGFLRFTILYFIWSLYRFDFIFHLIFFLFTYDLCSNLLLRFNRPLQIASQVWFMVSPSVVSSLHLFIWTAIPFWFPAVFP
jgi:hypothetical protein